MENVSGSAQDFRAGASFYRGYGDKNHSHDRLLGLTFRGADVVSTHHFDPKPSCDLYEFILVEHVGVPRFLAIGRTFLPLVYQRAARARHDIRWTRSIKSMSYSRRGIYQKHFWSLGLKSPIRNRPLSRRKKPYGHLFNRPHQLENGGREKQIFISR